MSDPGTDGPTLLTEDEEEPNAGLAPSSGEGGQSAKGPTLTASQRFAFHTAVRGQVQSETARVWCWICKHKWPLPQLTKCPMCSAELLTLEGASDALKAELPVTKAGPKILAPGGGAHRR